MIYAVTLNPAIDRYLSTSNFELNKTNKYDEVFDIYGGKAQNVVRVISQFKGDYKLVSKTDISNNQFIENSLDKINNKLFMSDNVRVNYKINDHGNITELNKQIDSVVNKSTLDIFTYLNEVVTINDYVLFAGSMNSDEISLIKEFSKSSDCNICIDCANVSIDDLKVIKPFFFKPNIDELEILFDTKIDHDNISIYTNKLIEIGVKHLVISLGGDGSQYYSKDINYQVSIASGKLINTVGAGDSFVGGFLSHLDLDLKDSLRYASASGCATAYSTSVGTIEDIKKLYKEITIKEI